MPLGPGKYGANAAKLIAEHNGTLCVVILVGNKGAGFDVAAIDPAVFFQIPDLLRSVADEITAELLTPDGPVS